MLRFFKKINWDNVFIAIGWLSILGTIIALFLAAIGVIGNA